MCRLDKLLHITVNSMPSMKTLFSLKSSLWRINLFIFLTNIEGSAIFKFCCLQTWAFLQDWSPNHHPIGIQFSQDFRNIFVPQRGFHRDKT